MGLTPTSRATRVGTSRFSLCIVACIRLNNAHIYLYIRSISLFLCLPLQTACPAYEISSCLIGSPPWVFFLPSERTGSSLSYPRYTIINIIIWHDSCHIMIVTPYCHIIINPLQHASCDMMHAWGLTWGSHACMRHEVYYYMTIGGYYYYMTWFMSYNNSNPLLSYNNKPMQNVCLSLSSVTVKTLLCTPRMSSPRKWGRPVRSNAPGPWGDCCSLHHRFNEKVDIGLRGCSPLSPFLTRFKISKVIVVGDLAVGKTCLINR